MDVKRRMLYGVIGGAGGTLVLSGLRRLMSRVGLVHDTAPGQVVTRLAELGVLDGISPRGRHAVAVLAHYAYGLSLGLCFGLLRRRRSGLAEETSVGASLGVLSWGAGWSSWLPLLGVHSPPWRQEGPKVLLPILDHAVFGAVWGAIRRLLPLV
jgi:hypothetical protein